MECTKIDGRGNMRHRYLVLIITGGSICLLICPSKDHECSKSMAVAAGSISVGVLAC
jgi:hypothetical protein